MIDLQRLAELRKFAGTAGTRTLVNLLFRHSHSISRVGDADT